MCTIICELFSCVNDNGFFNTLATSFLPTLALNVTELTYIGLNNNNNKTTIYKAQ